MTLDTHPDRLRLSFGGPRHAAVATSEAMVAGVLLEAAVLSASHQIRTLEGQVLETLACGGEGELPRSMDGAVSTTSANWLLSVDYVVTPTSSTDLSALVARLDRRATLVHRFTGRTDAVTAIQFLPAGWTTWHAYPEHGLVAISFTIARCVVPAGALT